MSFPNSIFKALPVALLMAGYAAGQTIDQRMSVGVAETKLAGGDDSEFSTSDNFQTKPAYSKSKWKALGLSLILPGAGQLYAGNKRKMTVFGSAEALIWTGFFGFRTYGGWKKEDYRAWAAFKAGAMVEGKSESFFEKMTYYDNLNEYNQFERLYEGSAAQLFPSTREFYWNWDSDASRDHFRNLRNQSKQAYRRSILVLGVAVANRILAGIDAYRSVASSGRQEEFGDIGWNLYCSTGGLSRDGEVEIGFTRKF